MDLERREFLRSLLAASIGAAMGDPCGAAASRDLAHPNSDDIAGPGHKIAHPRWLSHPPMRPLPVASDRELDEHSPAYYMALDGHDSNNGTTLASPWRTLAKAQSVMGPGDTLYVRGGRYWTWTSIDTTYRWSYVSGSLGSPITIRSFPGELATFSAGYQEFFDDPDSAWEPVPAGQGGVEGEYWSTKVYPIDPQHRIVAGNFGDSMIPFARYQTMEDFRSKNEFMKSSMKDFGHDPMGIYFGPGAIWNHATERIHIRLTHSHIESLAENDFLGKGAGFDNNYTGETDPRNIPLIICRRASPGLTSSYLRIQDVVFDGADTVEIGARDTRGVELDGVHVYVGTPPRGFVLRGTNATMRSCRIRGYDAPWHSRFTDKNRTEPGVLAALHATDLTVTRCEFTDHHDGVVFAHDVATADFNRNLVDNMNDDGLYLSHRHPTQIVHVYQNLLGATASKLPFLDGGQGVEVTDPDAGLYIFRNLFDLRRAIYNSPPSLDDNVRNFRLGSLLQEHGPVTGANVYFYHNIIAVLGRQRTYMAGLGEQYEESTRRVYNNILVQVEDRLQQRVRPAANGDFRAHSNLQWGIAGGPTGEHPGDIYADPAFAAFHADWRLAHDWRLRSTSPAINRGFELPKAWPDSLRALDAGPPDIGAIPYGVDRTVFGPGSEL
jgi:hypothetical protein